MKIPNVQEFAQNNFKLFFSSRSAQMTRFAQTPPIELKDPDPHHETVSTAIFINA
jgi:hypothetical protein